MKIYKPYCPKSWNNFDFTLGKFHHEPLTKLALSLDGLFFYFFCGFNFFSTHGGEEKNSHQSMN